MPKHRSYTISGVNAGQVQECHDETSAVDTSKMQQRHREADAGIHTQLRGTSGAHKGASPQAAPYLHQHPAQPVSTRCKISETHHTNTQNIEIPALHD
jgi:hypothetical protein